jgi:hypothetical protein
VIGLGGGDATGDGVLRRLVRRERMRANVMVVCFSYSSGDV